LLNKIMFVTRSVITNTHNFMQFRTQKMHYKNAYFHLVLTSGLTLNFW